MQENYGPLYIKKFAGDEYDPPKVWICSTVEQVIKEDEFPRHIRPVERVVFVGDSSDEVLNIAEKLVDLYNREHHESSR